MLYQDAIGNGVGIVIAICQIRQQPHYRREAFENGLRRAGYSIVQSGHPGAREDLLVIWNRYGAFASMADVWEKQGGTVLVCENGYIGRDEEDRQYYAIGVHGHNGSGWFPVGDEDRFSKLGIELEPYHPHGEHVVVRGQRGIGLPHVASPPNWHDEMGRILRKTMQLPIKIIPHPGNVDPKPTHDDDLRKSEALVIWSSAMGVRALTLGTRVFYGSPHWVCDAAGLEIDATLPDRIKSGQPWNDEADFEQGREIALHKMSWGQRSVSEIESGEPFTTIREHLAECPTW